MVTQSIDALLEKLLDSQISSHMEKDFENMSQDGFALGCFYFDFNHEINTNHDSVRPILEALKKADFISGTFVNNGNSYFAYKTYENQTSTHGKIDDTAMVVRNDLTEKRIPVRSVSFVANEGNFESNLKKAQGLVLESVSRGTHYHAYK